MKISAHTLVKNEERFIWFSINSIIDYVDEVLLWDTGSTDDTIQIIKELKKTYPSKIKVNFLGSVDIREFTQIRQEMIHETNSDWIIIVDGDEVWWDDKIKETTRLMRENKTLQTIVNEYRNLVGDIYHFQDPKASYYKFDGKKGPYTIRAISLRNIKGLNANKPHGKQGYFDKNGVLVQDLNSANRAWINGISYLHFTHLIRSSSLDQDKKVIKRDIKYKHELGYSFDYEFFYPEALFKYRPNQVKEVWQKRTTSYILKASILTPIRQIKRRIIPHKSGY